MMRRCLSALVALVMLGAPASAATLDEGALQISRARASDDRKISLVVNAPSEMGGEALPEEAFTVTEDGVARAATVTKLSSDQLRIVLVVDTSGSMLGEGMAAAKEAGHAFIDNMGEGARAAIIGFGTDSSVAQGFTDDAAALDRAIDGLSADGETALYDAVIAGVREVTRTKADRQALILLSDGGDTASDASLKAAARALARSQTTFYAVGLQTGETDVAALRRLRDAAGGTLVPGADPDALADVYAAIAGALRNQYLIAFQGQGEGRTNVGVRIKHNNATARAVESVQLPAAAPAPRPAPTAAPPPPAPRVQVLQPGVLASQGALMAGAAAVFLALLLLLLLALRPRPTRTRLAPKSSAPRTTPGGISSLADRTSRAADEVLRRRGKATGLNTAMEAAGINLRAGEFVILALCAAITAFAVGLLLSGVLMAVALAAVAMLVFRMMVSIMADRRRSRFGNQLTDTLQLLSGSIRAGHGLLQAIDAVANEAEAPTAAEFRRLVVEVRLGRDLTAALEAMANRINNEDFTWVVQAISIHREVGGDLAEVLDAVGRTIRERNQIRRQIKALSAEGKLSAYVLLALPFAVGFMISLANPEYLLELTETDIGRLLLGAGLALMIIGGLWMRRLIRLRF